MTTQYVRYPSTSGSGSGLSKYANFASLPGTASDGDAAVTLDTDKIYIYNLATTTWLPVGGPGVPLGIGTIDSSSPSANGLVINASNLLVAQSASATFPGVVNLTTQSFAGNKTFTGTIAASNLSGTNTGDVTLGTANGLSLVGQVLSLTGGNLTVPSILSISGGTGAVLGSGTSITVASQGTGNQFFASPNGSSGTPTFRAIVAADVPTLNQNTTGTASNVTGTVAVANGGTGQVSLTTHGVLVGAATSGITQLAAAAAGTLLTGQGASADPSFSATPVLGINATTAGSLGIANGGGSGATATIQNLGATSAYNFNLPINAGSAGKPLVSQGGGATSMTFSTIGILGGGTNNSSLGVVAGGAYYGDGAKLMQIAAGTSGQVFTSGGTGAPTWTTPYATPLTTVGDMVYEDASPAPARLPIGTANQALMVLGSNNIPSWNSINQFNNKNYINANPNAEVDTTGWATYANSAANIPSNGTGGSATNLTFSRSTSSPLRGTASFSMVQANSTSLQGKGVSYSFTIDSADQAKVLSVQFDYNASSTFVASNGSTPPLNDGTTTTNAGNSDIEIFMYDVTNAVLIPVSPEVITSNGANNFVFKGDFQTASNSTSYRLIFHVATTSANATGWTFKFDNLYVGPQVQVQGAPVIDWTSYTPTGSWVSNATYTGQYARVGDTLWVRAHVAVTGTPTSATLTINLPSGLSIDTTKVNFTSGNTTLGTASMLSAGSGYTGTVIYTSTTAVQVDCNKTIAGTNPQPISNNGVTQASPATFANADYVDILFQVPIAGWSSTVSMSNDTDTRVIAARAVNATASITGSYSDITWTTVSSDSAGGFSASSSTPSYTITVSGYYNFSGVVTITGTSTAGQQDFVSLLNSTTSTTLAEAGITLAAFTTTASQVPFNFKDILLTAGTVIKLQVKSSITSPTIVSSTTGNYLQIDRISGPSAIASNETVAASYYMSVGQNQNVIYNFDTKIYDTHNAVTTGASWKFTAPISGKYRIQANYQSSVTNQVSIYKNGSQFCTIADSISATQVNGSRTLALIAGDYVHIIAGGSGTLSVGTSTTQLTAIAIERVGN